MNEWVLLHNVNIRVTDPPGGLAVRAQDQLRQHKWQARDISAALEAVYKRAERSISSDYPFSWERPSWGSLPLVSDWPTLQPCARLATYLFIWMLTLAFRQAPWLDPGPAPFPVAPNGDLVSYADAEHRHRPCPARLLQMLSDKTLDSKVPALAALIRLLAYFRFWSSQPSLLSWLQDRGGKWMQSWKNFLQLLLFFSFNKFISGEYKKS